MPASRKSPGLAGEGEVGVQARLEVAQDLADGAAAPAHRVAQADLRRLDGDADVLDGKAGQPRRAFHGHGAAAERGRALRVSRIVRWSRVTSALIAVRGCRMSRARSVPSRTRIVPRASGLAERSARGDVQVGEAGEGGLLQQGRQGAELEHALARGLERPRAEVGVAVHAEGAARAGDHEAVRRDVAGLQPRGDGRDLQLQILNPHVGRGEGQFAVGVAPGSRGARDTRVAGRASPGRVRGRAAAARRGPPPARPASAG